LSEFNIAADYAINPGIVADGFKLPASVLIDPQYAGLSAEEIFRLRQVQQQQAASSEGDASDDSGEQSDESGETSEDETEGDQSDTSDKQGETESESSDVDGNGDTESEKGDGKGDGEQGDDSEGEGEGDNASDNAAPISDPGSCGGIMDAAPTQDAAAMAQAESDIDQRIRQAIAVARKANGGELPADLARLVGELKAPKLDARDMLRRFHRSQHSKVIRMDATEQALSESRLDTAVPNLRSAPVTSLRLSTCPVHFGRMPHKRL
jgi:hypothetical protein